MSLNVYKWAGAVPFLDMLPRRREDGSLDFSVYRKPTHTKWYLYFESPSSDQRILVRCLHDKVRGVVMTQNNLQGEVDHLARVLKQNGYPTNFTILPHPHMPVMQRPRAAVMRGRRNRLKDYW